PEYFAADLKTSPGSGPISRSRVTLFRDWRPVQRPARHEGARRIAQETLRSGRQAHVTAQATLEHTSRAKLFRKRRSGRPETRQRPAAPSRGSGKHQTPPNRYPPARL